MDFKPFLEKANPTSIDSFLDNLNPLKRNVSAQPLYKYWPYLVLKQLWESRTETGSILAPAVTVCGGHQKTKAWRDLEGLDKALEDCNASHAFFNCVESKAWSLDDVVLGAQKGSETKESLMNTEFWTANFYKNFACFTFASKLAIGTNDLEDELTFFLNKSLIYKFYVHSSSYFIQNLFPAFPFNRFKALPMKDCSSYTRLTLTEQVELDTPGDPCEELPGYSFTACVEESVARRVGCARGQAGQGSCSTRQQYRWA